MYLPFENLSDTSKVWIYQADRALTADEQTSVSNQLEEFCAHWEAHGTPLNAGFKIFSDQFIVVAVDEENQSATGCSIDKSVGVVKKIGAELNVDFFNRSNIAFEASTGEISIVPMLQIKSNVEAGVIGTDWKVYNNSISQKKDLTAAWKQNVLEGWTKKYFANVVS